MPPTSCPKARRKSVIMQELNGELLIYDSITHKAYCLNQTSSLIWRACDGESSVPEISENLSNQLRVPITDDLVWLALDQLKKDNLLENSDDVKVDFGGLSRREVIKKIGLASMVGLPVIASLVAPPASHAASCAPPGAACTFPRPDLCCSNCCTSAGAPPGGSICC